MKLSFEQGIAAGVAGLVATALIAGVLLVDHGAGCGHRSKPARRSRHCRPPTGDAAFRDDATHASVVFAGWVASGACRGVFQHVKGVSQRGLPAISVAVRPMRVMSASAVAARPAMPKQ